MSEFPWLVCTNYLKLHVKVKLGIYLYALSADGGSEIDTRLNPLCNVQADLDRLITTNLLRQSSARAYSKST